MKRTISLLLICSLWLYGQGQQQLIISQKIASGGGSAPTFVSEADCSGSGTSCTITQAVPANSLVVVDIFNSDSSGNSATNSHSDTFVSVTGSVCTETVSGRKMEEFYFVSTAVLTTITATRGAGAGGNIEVIATIYSGSAAQATVKDKAVCGQNQDVTAYTTGNTSATTNALDLFHGAGWTNSGTFTAGTGFTIRPNALATPAFSEDKSTSATGTYAATATCSAQGYGPMITSLYKGT